MKHLRRLPTVSLTVLLALLVVAGFAAALVGVYLELGLSWTLIVGGVVAMVAGLMVDAA